VGRCSLFSHHRSTENFSVQKLGLKCKSSSSCCFVAHLVLHFIPSLRTLCRERDRDRDGNRRRAGSSHTLQGTRCYVASLLRSCGYFVISKSALNGCVNLLVFCLYRDAIAVCILVPLAFFTEMKLRPKCSVLVLN
jgi:hypothetical protein